MKTRVEKDSMGDMNIPANALYGASTQRAVLNFPISGKPLRPIFIHTYGMLKACAAEANASLGLLDAPRALRIAAAGREIAAGLHDSHFPVDVYQTGSGTSTNMNVNEVIATLANAAGGESVHPNDHVNLGQSSNDTFPTVMHIAAALALQNQLAPALAELAGELENKAREFSTIVKIGRTHLMDATPVTLGQEFSGWAAQIRFAEQRCTRALHPLLELALGGTAVGTGINTHPQFAAKTIATLADHFGLPFREAANHFEAQAARDACVEAHGMLQTIAVSLHKIACDVRLLASGPRCALGEINLPAIQPGSSIMPGKTNPVIPEVVTMVAARVAGNQTTVAWCGAGGFLELNVSMPLLADVLLESIELLASAAREFGAKAIAGITANREACDGFIERSLSMVTSLVPLIGYDRAAEIAKESVSSGRTVRELCHEKTSALGITAAQIEAALDPAKMANP